MGIKLLSEAQQNLICDVLEAIEQARKYAPLYRAVLAQTGDKKQAEAAVRFISRMEDEVDSKRKAS